MKSKLKLDEIFRAIDRIKKRRGCNVQEITNSEIIEELRNLGITASDSTSGPMLRAALDDAMLAETLNTDTIPTNLLAAYHRDRKNVAADTLAAFKKQREKEDAEHERVLAEFEALKNEAGGLRTLVANETAKCQTAEKALAEANGREASHNELLEAKNQQINTLGTELAEKRKELTETKEENSKLREALNAARDKETSLKNDLKKEEEKANGALLSHKIEEQKSAGLVALNEEIKSNNTKLEKRSEELFGELKNCQDKLLEATKEKAEAIARLNERSKKSDRNSSKKAVKSSAGNGGHGGEKPTPNTC